jgi:aromatic-L-amino-acid decarboxylase
VSTLAGQGVTQPPERQRAETEAEIAQRDVVVRHRNWTAGSTAGLTTIAQVRECGTIRDMPVLADPSPDEFRDVCSRLTELAVEYLAGLDARAIFPQTSGPTTQALFAASAAPEDGLGLAALDELPQVLAHSRAQNGRFFGYVLGSGDPVAASADLLASVLNQNVTSWRSAPAAATIERAVVRWLAEAIGCAGFTGSLAGGGSSANLMALAMAREAKLPANESGARPGTVIYASSEAHMSIGKAAALLGVGRENLRHISVDAQFRMRMDALEDAIVADRRAGRTPIAIVAAAGTVSTGAVDPIAAIAHVARRHDLWLHVDGAYGALAAMAIPNAFAGLDQADSISLDPHKWLYQPMDCGCLLYRRAADARRAFSHTGDYARALTEDPIEGQTFFDESLELSRRFRALRLWLSIRYHGLAAFRGSILHDLAMARRLAAAVEREPDLELLAPVELSAVCFRHRLADATSGLDLNGHNQRLLQRVIERGGVYLSNALLDGRFALRACITNHRTTEADVDQVVPEVLLAAERVR